jgi:hypothetical protein
LEQGFLGALHLIDPLPNLIVELFAVAGENFLPGTLKILVLPEFNDGSELGQAPICERSEGLDSLLLNGIVCGELR